MEMDRHCRGVFQTRPYGTRNRRIVGDANVGAGFKPARTEPETAALLGHANVGAGFKPARTEPKTGARRAK